VLCDRETEHAPEVTLFHDSDVAVSGFASLRRHRVGIR